LKHKISRKQFARIDSGFLSWDFNIEDENNDILGSVNRNFRGFAREVFIHIILSLSKLHTTKTYVYVRTIELFKIFTDTGQYVIRMDSAQSILRGLSLDERAVILAAAISIDFDYFSRHSEHGGFV